MNSHYEKYRETILKTATEWNKKHPKKHSEAIQRWKKRNPEKTRKYTQKHQKTSAYKEYQKKFHKKWEKIARKKLKSIVVKHYSEDKNCCACCGEKFLEFLTIDHINGGGSKHRKKVGSAGSNFYRWIIKNNFPTGLRILCFNCNFANGMFGHCPHNNVNQ